MPKPRSMRERKIPLLLPRDRAKFRNVRKRRPAKKVDGAEAVVGSVLIPTVLMHHLCGLRELSKAGRYGPRSAVETFLPTAAQSDALRDMPKDGSVNIQLFHETLAMRFLKSILVFLFAVLSIVNLAIAESLIEDPIADYLSMNVPDRITNVGKLLLIKRIDIDMEGNGKNTVFVGTWYRKSGPDTWMWVGYRRASKGFDRITPMDSDVLIDFEGIYVGYLPDFNKHGMAQSYSLELNNKDRDQSNIINLSFYYIEDGRLKQTDMAGLDRDDPAQEAKFDYYFNPKREPSEKLKVESMTVLDLVQRGYHVPFWRSAGQPTTQ